MAQTLYKIKGKVILYDDSIVTKHIQNKNETLAIINSKSGELIKQVITDSLLTFNVSIDTAKITPGLYEVILLNSYERKNKYSKSFFIVQDKFLYDLGVFQLEQKPVTLEEVKVMASAPLYYRKQDKLIVNIENSVLANGSSLTELLQKLPGIRIDLSGNITVNGKDGVLITIDGKGTYVQKEQIQAILSSLKSDGIKSLEIIANPSSKYDANQGSVINIVTKKNSALSDVHLNYNTPIYPINGISGLKYPAFTSGTNLKYSFGKLLSTLSADYTNNRGYGNKTIDSTYFYNLNNVRKSSSESFYQEQKLNAILGLTYTLNKGSFLSLDYMLIHTFQSKGQAVGRIDFKDLAGNIDSFSIYNASSNSSRFTSQSATLKYSQNIGIKQDKHLDISYDINQYYSPVLSETDNIDNNNINSTSSSYSFNSKRYYRILMNSIKADFTDAINKSAILYFGMKYTHTKSSDSSSSFTYTNTINQLSSGRFTYRESIWGAYMMLSLSFKKLEGQVGLRSEYTTSNGYTSEKADLANQNYFNLFPSGNVFYTIDPNNKIGYSYNKRIGRVSFNDFNPIIRYNSPYSATVGDANLKPQFINYHELSFLHKQLYISIERSVASNSRFDIPLITQSASLVTRKYENIPQKTTNEINISIPFKFKRWWSSFNNATVSNTSYLFSDDNKLTYTSYNITTSQMFQASKLTSLDLTVGYYSSNRMVYIVSKGYTNLSIGARTYFFNRKITASLNVSDVLGTYKYHTISQYPTQASIHNVFRNNRSITISIKYNFDSGLAFNRSRSTSKNDFGEKRY